MEQGGGGGSGGETYDDTELRNRVGALETSTAGIRTTLNAVGQKADANETSILSMATDIQANQTAIRANQTAIQSNQNAIQVNQTAIQAMNSSIGDLQTALSSKQDRLTAGSGIDITQNVISVNATTPISSFVVDSSTDVSHFIDNTNHYTRDMMLLSGDFKSKLNFFKGEPYRPNSYLGCHLIQTVNVETGAVTYDVYEPLFDVKAVIQSAQRSVTLSGSRMRISTDGDTQTIAMDANTGLGSMSFTIYTRE